LPWIVSLPRAWLKLRKINQPYLQNQKTLCSPCTGEKIEYYAFLMSTLESRATALLDEIGTVTDGQDDPRQNFGLALDIPALQQIAAGQDEIVDSEGFVVDAEKRLGQAHSRQQLEAAGFSYAAEIPSRTEVRQLMRDDAGMTDENAIELAMPGDLQHANEQREVHTILRNMGLTT
jgi:hypothetical protein